MRAKRPFMVLAFSVTEDVFSMEDYCRRQGIPVRIIPLPPAVDAGCGLCIMMEVSDFKKNREILSRSGTAPEKVQEVLLYG